ncbi:hypothetical protein HK096_011637, partial [Nowakowskiella sp. JEL0078]
HCLYLTLQVKDIPTLIMPYLNYYQLYISTLHSMCGYLNHSKSHTLTSHIMNLITIQPEI